MLEMAAMIQKHLSTFLRFLAISLFVVTLLGGSAFTMLWVVAGGCTTKQHRFDVGMADGVGGTEDLQHGLGVETWDEGARYRNCAQRQFRVFKCRWDYTGGGAQQGHPGIS